MDELAIWTDGTDTVVARDAADATAVMVEASGMDPSECGAWTEVTGPTLTIVHVDDPGQPKDTRTLAEWISYAGGRGLLASTEN